MGNKGFTLLEVLASVAVLGLGIVAVMRLFSGSMGLAKSSSDSSSLVLFAKERMNEAILRDGVREGYGSGSAAGFKWELAVKDFEGFKPVEGIRIFELKMETTGPSGAPVVLSTLKAVSDKR
ncbi:hypothetical protein BAC1_01579 [uncultured bacterium]|nr:hypothetical protein BAC1_01579 [uncultured bacterium]